MAKWAALLCLNFSIFSAAAQDFVVSVPEGNALIDYARNDLGEAYRRIGLHMVLRPTPSARSLVDANQGLVDAEAGRIGGMTREFPNLIQIPEPLIQFEFQAITVGPPMAGEGWDSLKGRRICIILGDKMIEARTRGLERETARTNEGAIRMLRAGRCDAMMMNQFNWLDIDRLHLGPFCLATSTLETVSLFHYVNQKHADLVPKLAEVMRVMRQDGTTAGFLAPVLRQVEAAKTRNHCDSAAKEFKDAAHR